MKKQSNKRPLRALAALLLAALLLPGAGLAEELAWTSRPVGFAVSPIFPDNQFEGVGYYWLLTPPGTQQTIGLNVSNKESEPITVDISLQDAHTNPNGILAYGGEAELSLPDGAWPALIHGTPLLSDVARLDLDALLLNAPDSVLAVDGNLVTLAPRASVQVPITLTLPDQPLDGQVLGGIVATQMPDEGEEMDVGFGVRSVYSYTIAILLQSEREVDVAQSFAVHSATYSSVAGFPAITVHVENNAPAVINGITCRLHLYAQGNDIPVLDSVQENLAMAPQTTMPYTRLLPDGKALAPGDYRVVLDWEQGGASTRMEAAFTVPEAAAR